MNFIRLLAALSVTTTTAFSPAFTAPNSGTKLAMSAVATE